MKSAEIFEKFKKRGLRITKARRKIVEIFISTRTPLSAADLLKLLKKNNIYVNKTTVYRELSFLKKQQIIIEIYISSGGRYYEFSLLPHHHHLVCHSCGLVEGIICRDVEGKIDQLEKKITNDGFTIKMHQLEFLGLCINCR